MTIQASKGDAMRGLVGLIGLGMVFAVSSAWAQRYDPSFPVCMEVAEENGSHMECMFTSMEQCKEGAKGMPGSCFNNPFYRPPPAPAVEAASEPAPTPTPSPTPAKKKKKP
jgi:hypothetical protein